MTRTKISMENDSSKLKVLRYLASGQFLETRYMGWLVDGTKRTT